MKFKEGQIVKHKLSKEKFIIIKFLPVKWYRSRPQYKVSIGLKVMEMRKQDEGDYVRVYESEIESSSKTREVKAK